MIRYKKIYKILIFIKLTLVICIYLDRSDNTIAPSLLNEPQTYENKFLNYLSHQLEQFENNVTFNETLKSSNLLLDILHKHNAFLIDLDIIQNLYQLNKSFHSFSFGIYFKKYLILHKILERSQCDYFNSKQTKYFNITIPSAIYLKCNNISIQISAFYDRGKFVWIPGDDFYLDKKKYFNDKPRAINRFKITQISGLNSKFNVPSNIKQFLFDYKHSEFIECSHQLAHRIFLNADIKYRQNITKNKIISDKLSYITSILESFRKEYWLAGGSLLGWYRECGVIPHTTDIDLGLFSNEYDPLIKQRFRGNRIIPLMLTFGYPEDSYELRLGSNGLWADLFYFYDFNKTHQWCAYQDKRVKKRRFISKFKLCSGELFDQKYLVPCDPSKYLNEEYGRWLWMVPQERNYTWTNVVYWNNWTQTEWPNAVKFYDTKGNFLKNETKKYVDMYL